MQLPAPLLRNNPSSYKNNFGHALILAGSRRMIGAAALASMAAFRAGAGLVTVGTPRSLVKILQKKLAPEVMVLPLPQTSDETISSRAAEQISISDRPYSALGIGPGLTLNPSTQKFVHEVLLTADCPVVTDADALNILAKDLSQLKLRSGPTILTPHPGEMSRLMGQEVPSNDSEREQIACEFARQHGCIVVLKGHRTVVASEKGEGYRNATGNVGMATAGSGDVLTGIITALLAQGVSAFESAKFGVYLHGFAGDLAVQSVDPVSLMASDIISAIPTSLAQIRNNLTN